MNRLCVFLLLMSLMGCTTARFHMPMPNGDAAEGEVLEFTGLFEAREVLVPGKIELLLSADLQKAKIDKKMYTEDPDAAWAWADLRINLHNQTRHIEKIKLELVKCLDSGFDATYYKNSEIVRLVPDTVERIEAKEEKIAFFAQEINLLIVWTYKGERFTRKIRLERLTVEKYKQEYERTFGEKYQRFRT